MKVIHLLFALIFVLFASKISLDAELIKSTVSAECAILINADTGKVLFEKNGSRQCFPASITKIATALYVLKEKNIDLDQLIEAKPEAIGTISPAAKKKNNYKSPPFWIESGSSHISIQKGEKLSLRALLYATLLASANDASNVIAQYAGNGSIDTFMKDLNVYLKKIGCKNTLFLNPHGLHDPKHKTSVRDMAFIAREAMKVPAFARIVCSKYYECKQSNSHGPRSIISFNQLLKKGHYYYKHAIGIKTGYTSDAGPTLVAAARKNGVTLIAVVMRCKKRSNTYQDVIKLFDAGFAIN